MCQNEVKADEKIYQRTSASVVVIIIGVGEIQDVFKENVKNADFATNRPTIFQHHICHFYETDITDLSKTFCWRLALKKNCPLKIAMLDI